MADTPARKQLLHLVFGGELERLEDVEFKDLTYTPGDGGWQRSRRCR